MQPLYQTSYVGFYIKVFTDHVEFKNGQGVQSVLLNQIASVQVGTPLLMQIILHTTNGASYVIPTTKKKDVEQAIRSAQARMPQPAQQVYQQYQQPVQPGYPVQQPYQQPVSIGSQVKMYSSTKEFQRDQNRMAKQGWIVQNTTSHQPRRSIGGLLFVPFAMLRPPKPQIMVTYQKMR